VEVPPPPVAPAPVLPAKAGPFLLSARAGPGLPLVIFALTTFANTMNATSGPTELSLGLEIGFALSASRNVYLVIPTQVQMVLGDGGISAATIMVPLGIQIDIPIRAAPGLYLYPRISVGYAVGLFPSNPADSTVVQMGVLLPEFGIKYVIKRRVNLGFEPLSLPVFVSSKNVLLYYRPLFAVGVNL
jgi:hypothetical protein